MNYSVGDEALNEDARVQLHRLNREQALLGLVESRNRLRQLAGPSPNADVSQQQQAMPQVEQGAQGFDAAQAERVRTSLSLTDSENLDLIIGQLIQTQEAAAGTSVPLVIAMPLRGRVLEFGRAIQVEPNAEMTVIFDADPPGVAGFDPDTLWTAVVFVALLVLLALLPRVAAHWRAMPRGARAVVDEEDLLEDDGFFEEEI
jgi:hypothetical protein